MRAVLVTSQVTYIPGGYAAPIEEMILGAREHFAGLIVLENLSLDILKSGLGLLATGCSGLAGALFKNIVELPLRKRERLCRRAGVPVLRARSMNDRKIIDWIRREGIDLVVNLRTRCIYKSEILSAPRLGCINIHHGVLPDFRGTFCDLYALFEGRRAGFTIHQMNEKIDAGRILVRREVSGPGERDYPKYLAEVSKEEGLALVELIKGIARAGQLPEGIENRSSAPIYTRNPNRSRIAEFRRGGLRL